MATQARGLRGVLLGGVLATLPTLAMTLFVAVVVLYTNIVFRAALGIGVTLWNWTIPFMNLSSALLTVVGFVAGLACVNRVTWRVNRESIAASTS